MMGKEINVLALVKGEEQYLFLFDDSNRTETLRLLGRYAADPELSFTWYDAAVLSQKIRSALPSQEQSPSLFAMHAASVPQSSQPSTTRTTPRFQFPAVEKERLPEEHS